MNILLFLNIRLDSTLIDLLGPPVFSGGSCCKNIKGTTFPPVLYDRKHSKTSFGLSIPKPSIKHLNTFRFIVTTIA